MAKRNPARDRASSKSPARCGAAADPDPYVIVDFVFDRGVQFIAVENIGTRPAFGVRVEFSHKLTGASGTVVSDLPLFNALEFLPGGKKITTLFDSSESYFSSKQPIQITTRISY